MFKKLTFITISHILVFLLIAVVLNSFESLATQIVKLINLLIDGSHGLGLGFSILILLCLPPAMYYFWNDEDWVKRFKHYFLKTLISSPRWIIGGFLALAFARAFVSSGVNYENLLGFSICFHYAFGDPINFEKPWSIDHYHNKTWFKVFFGLIIIVLLLLPFFNLNFFDLEWFK